MKITYNLNALVDLGNPRFPILDAKVTEEGVVIVENLLMSIDSRVYTLRMVDTRPLTAKALAEKNKQALFGQIHLSVTSVTVTLLGDGSAEVLLSDPDPESVSEGTLAFFKTSSLLEIHNQGLLLLTSTSDAGSDMDVLTIYTPGTIFAGTWMETNLKGDCGAIEESTTFRNGPLEDE